KFLMSGSPLLRMDSPGRPARVPAPAGTGRPQRAGRVGDPLRRPPAKGLGTEPDLDRRASAVRADVGVANGPATAAFGSGLPQSPPARQTGDAGLAPVIPCPS